MIKLVLAGAACGALIGLYFYFRPPQITPVSQATLDHYVRMEGLEGDLP